MRRIDVLPVYPQMPFTFWSYKIALGYIGKKAVMPPTGLATVLAMLPPERFDVQPIVDLNVEALTDYRIQNADVIFTSTMIVQEDSHNEVLDRAHYYGKKVVAGGPFVSTYPERTKADYIVSGEAEVTLEPFLEDFLGGAASGVWTEANVKGRGAAVLTRTGRADITRTPLPRWDLLDLNDYYSAAIQYSRGCPFDCEFCDITKLYGRESRTKNPQQMITEFDALSRAGFTGPVFIVDDNFIGNKKNVKQLLPVLAGWQREHDYPYRLFTEASMNLAWDSNRDILDGMNEAGFDFVFLGIESVDDRVLEKMNKRQNSRLSQLESVRRIQQAGIEVSGGFIIGSDGEDKTVFDRLFHFIQEAGIPVPMPGLLIAIKDTDLYNRFKREGRLREETHGNNTHQLAFNFQPQLDEQFLIEGYKNLIRRLFEPKHYYERCRVLQTNIGANHSCRRKPNRDDYIAFWRSLRRQLIARGGWEYAKYLSKTAVCNPSRFSDAVARAIKFDHFNTLTRTTIEAHDCISWIQALHDSFLRKLHAIRSRRFRNDEKKRQAVCRLSRKVITIAEKRYRRLHEDFRREAAEALEGLRRCVHFEVTGN